MCVTRMNYYINWKLINVIVYYEYQQRVSYLRAYISGGLRKHNGHLAIVPRSIAEDENYYIPFVFAKMLAN